MMKSDEEFKCLENKDNRNSMLVLREVNKCLKMEYNYYDKASVSKKINNNIAMT